MLVLADSIARKGEGWFARRGVAPGCLWSPFPAYKTGRADLMELALDLIGGRNSVRIEPSSRVWEWRDWRCHAEQVNPAQQHSRRRVALARVGRWQRVQIDHGIGVRQAQRTDRGPSAPLHDLRLDAPATGQELNRLGRWSASAGQQDHHADRGQKTHPLILRRPSYLFLGRRKLVGQELFKRPAKLVRPGDCLDG